MSSLNFKAADTTKNEHGQWTLPEEVVEKTLPEGISKENIEAVDAWRRDALKAAGETYQTVLKDEGFCPGGENEDEMRPSFHIPLFGATSAKWAVVNNSDPFLAVRTDYGKAVTETRTRLKEFLTGSDSE